VYQEQFAVDSLPLTIQDEKRNTTANPKSKIPNRKSIEAHYVLTAANQVRFALGPYDHTKPLCIDPILYYSTYLGGSVGDTGFGIAVDSQGNAYIAGVTQSPISPTAPHTGPVSPICGPTGSSDPSGCASSPRHAFVTELNSTGTAVVYYTYLGGSGTINGDYGYGVAVDSSFDAYVTGQTDSGDFPTVNPLPGSIDNTPITGNGPNLHAEHYGTGFVAELPPGGASLVFSTYLGGSNPTEPSGSGPDVARGIAIDPSCSSSSCQIFVTGYTKSTDFPTHHGYESSLPASTLAAFVSELNWSGAALTLPYSTYLGGV